jgi:uncharacterized protein with NAD-binding domain and iron-sulfur cluster
LSADVGSGVAKMSFKKLASSLAFLIGGGCTASWLDTASAAISAFATITFKLSMADETV